MYLHTDIIIYILIHTKYNKRRILKNERTFKDQN